MDVDEVVVVDTGSTDATVRVAEDLGAVVERYEVTDGGMPHLAHARNVGIERARGDVVLVLDADGARFGDVPDYAVLVVGSERDGVGDASTVLVAYGTAAAVSGAMTLSDQLSPVASMTFSVSLLVCTG